MHSYNNQKIILYDIPRYITKQQYKLGMYREIKRYRKKDAHVFIFTNSPIPEDIYNKDRITI